LLSTNLKLIVYIENCLLINIYTYFNEVSIAETCTFVVFYMHDKLISCLRVGISICMFMKHIIKCSLICEFVSYFIYVIPESNDVL